MYQRRYGIRPGTGTAAPSATAVPVPVAQPPSANPALRYHFVGEGTWKNEGGAYSLSVQVDGRDQKSEASFKGDTLIIGRAGMGMLFEKQ